MTLGSNPSGASVKKQQIQAIEDQRKKLLHAYTEQMKTVMARINDPKTSEKNREQYQTMLTALKEKMNALTPKKPEPPAPPPQPTPPTRPEPHWKGYGKHSLVFNQAGSGPAMLRLSELPAELRRDEARLRQALGEGVTKVRAWSEDGSSCIADFGQRKLAKAASRAQKVWGFNAEVVSVQLGKGKKRGKPEPAQMEDEEDDAASSVTEVMETDIEEEDAAAAPAMDVEPPLAKGAEETATAPAAVTPQSQ
jgi:hypothetical protein